MGTLERESQIRKGQEWTREERLRQPHLIDKLGPGAAITLLGIGTEGGPIDGLAGQKEQGALEEQQAHVHDPQHLPAHMPHDIGVDAEG